MNLITTVDEPELSSSWGFPFSELYLLIPKMALGILVNQLAIWRRSRIWGGQFIQTAFTLDWERVCVCCDSSTKNHSAVLEWSLGAEAQRKKPGRRGQKPNECWLMATDAFCRGISWSGIIRAACSASASCLHERQQCWCAMPPFNSAWPCLINCSTLGWASYTQRMCNLKHICAKGCAHI